MHRFQIIIIPSAFENVKCEDKSYRNVPRGAYSIVLKSRLRRYGKDMSCKQACLPESGQPILTELSAYSAAYASPSAVVIVRYRRLQQWAGHVAGMSLGMHTESSLGNLLESNNLEYREGNRDNIKLDLTENNFEDNGWVECPV